MSTSCPGKGSCRPSLSRTKNHGPRVTCQHHPSAGSRTRAWHDQLSPSLRRPPPKRPCSPLQLPWAPRQPLSLVFIQQAEGVPPRQVRPWARLLHPPRGAASRRFRLPASPPSAPPILQPPPGRAVPSRARLLSPHHPLAQPWALCDGGFSAPARAPNPVCSAFPFPGTCFFPSYYLNDPLTAFRLPSLLTSAHEGRDACLSCPLIGPKPLEWCS